MTARRKAAIGSRAPRPLRRQVARALAKATGPEEVHRFRLSDGTVIVSVASMYVWRGMMPNGEPFGFITPTPELAYAELIDLLADRIHRGERGWTVIEHSAACREVGVGCICHPAVVRDVVWEGT